MYIIFKSFYLILMVYNYLNKSKTTIVIKEYKANNKISNLYFTKK